MIAKIQIIFFIQLIAFTVNAQRYYISMHFGNNYFKLLENSYHTTSHNSISLIPRYNRSGIGINMGIATEKDGFSDCCCGVENCRKYDDVMRYFQPQLYLQGNYFGFIPGLLILTGTGEGPDVFILPSLSIRVGNLRKCFISLEGLSDVYHGGASINLNYIPFDNFSIISIGRFKAENKGICYTFQMKLVRNIYIGFRGNVDFKNDKSGTQVIVGLAF